MDHRPRVESALRRAAIAAWEAARDALFPPRCLACRAFLAGSAGGRDADDRGSLPALLCEPCREGIVPVGSPLCPSCGIPFHGRAGADHPCGRCIEAPPTFQMARAALVYARTAVDLVHALKYKGKLQLARPLGQLLRRTYELGWHDQPIDLVVPVPLHASRLRDRGYNQTELLVRRWGATAADRTGPPIAAEVLRRTRATAAQFGLKRSERESNIRGAFEVRRPSAVEGRRILLIDDVLTTGSTVEECARQLTRAGAARVDVLTLARAL
jgi:ComF family protein